MVCEATCSTYIGDFCSSTSSSSFPSSVHECWRSLLLHAMRRRPPGMLERCAAQLVTTATWAAWLKDLRRLFGERHLEREGGGGGGDGGGGVPGFTHEMMEELTAAKSELRRAGSTTTMASARTGWLSLFSALMRELIGGGTAKTFFKHT